MYKGKLMTNVSYMDNYLNLFDMYCIWGDWVTTMWRDAVLASMVLLLFPFGFRILSKEIPAWITFISVYTSIDLSNSYL